MELYCLAKQVQFTVVFLLLLSLLLPGSAPALAPIPVSAGGEGGPASAGPNDSISSLSAFARELPHSSANSPVGVYVKDVLALRVFAQPASNPGYVTSQADAVSLFGLAQQYGVTGLIAHNYLAGDSFSNLTQGQQVVLLMADGARQRYKIVSVRRLQALSPWSPLSNFVEVGADGEVLSASQLFHQVYTGSNRVVFQTCIEVDGNPVWGRLFVTAERIEPYPSTNWAAKLPALLLGSPGSRSL
jgi:hypothetical protein